MWPMLLVVYGTLSIMGSPWEPTITIGDVAVNWKEGIIWIGTGEVNSSRSSYAGVGVYKTTDMGKTWVHKGLDESHHIGKIVLNPLSAKVAWVAVLGHLYSTNPQRGIYKTTDGGETWKQTPRTLKFYTLPLGREVVRHGISMEWAVKPAFIKASMVAKLGS